MKTEIIIPQNWDDYELIDSGDRQKLERFGQYTIIRPEPQALWNRSMSEHEWNKMANCSFKPGSKAEERGEWSCDKSMPGQWYVTYKYKKMNLRMRMGLTAFKHVGLFPEQAANWNFIYDNIKLLGNDIKVLNLFAYTGGATLAARSAGADVTHVDSIKQVVNWSKDNMTASGLDNIRWIVEDAMKFVKREVKRGKKYQGIILDPPAYGRGADGERWVLDENINELLTECAKLLDRKGFLILNLYSMGLSALLAKTLVNQLFGKFETEQLGELCFKDKFGKHLPLGVFYRFTR